MLQSAPVPLLSDFLMGSKQEEAGIGFCYPL